MEDQIQTANIVDEAQADAESEVIRKRKNRDRKRAERLRTKIAKMAQTGLDDYGWTTFGEAQRQLVQQGFNPEDQIIGLIWKEYCSFGAPWSRSKSFFIFRADDHIDEEILAAWPSQTWDSWFGEVARGIDGNLMTQVHVCRELGLALGHRDIREGDTPRSFLKSVHEAWREKGFPRFNRFGGYLERLGLQRTLKTLDYSRSMRFGDKDDEWSAAKMVSSVGADTPIDEAKLRPLSGPLLTQV
jgi:hypothetical protein